MLRRATAVAIGAAVLSLAAAAPAASPPKLPCQPSSDVLLSCATTIRATKEPRAYRVLGRDWRGYMSSWQLGSREFLASGGPDYCKDYGRLAGVRVKEVSCDGRLWIEARALDHPQQITFEWSVMR